MQLFPACSKTSAACLDNGEDDVLRRTFWEHLRKGFSSIHNAFGKRGLADLLWLRHWQLYPFPRFRNRRLVGQKNWGLEESLVLFPFVPAGLFTLASLCRERGSAGAGRLPPATANSEGIVHSVAGVLCWNGGGHQGATAFHGRLELRRRININGNLTAGMLLL